MMDALFAWIFPALNVVGLTVLGMSLWHVYHALVRRNESLLSHLKELKEGHTQVVDVMQRRAQELERRFEDEKGWRDRYTEVMAMTETQQKKIWALKDEELAHLRKRHDEAERKVGDAEVELAKLRAGVWEARHAQMAFKRLEAEKKALEERVSRLQQSVHFRGVGG
jgi:chromosome segregation ATPase